MDHQKLTTADANELVALAKAAWRKASNRATQVKFKWRNRRFKSTLGMCQIHVDPDTPDWPRHEDGTVRHLTGCYGFVSDP